MIHENFSSAIFISIGIWKSRIDDCIYAQCKYLACLSIALFIYFKKLSDLERMQLILY